MGASDIECYDVGLMLLYGHIHNARVADDHRALQRLLVVDLTQPRFALLNRLQVVFHLLRLGHTFRLSALGHSLGFLASSALLRLLRHLTLFPAFCILCWSLNSFFCDCGELEFFFLRCWLHLPRRHFIQILHLYLLDLLLHFLGIKGRFLVLQLLLGMVELG